MFISQREREGRAIFVYLLGEVYLNTSSNNPFLMPFRFPDSAYTIFYMYLVQFCIKNS